MSDAPDLICLSHLRWGFVFQRPNHLMSACSKERRVFFFEEPMFGSGPAHLAVHEAAPNLYVVTPWLEAELQQKPHAEAQKKALFELCERYGIHQPVLWFYTPMALEFARELPARAVVYDCMDELSAFHGAPPQLRELERELFERADVVFTGGQSLYEAKREQHPNVHAFPSSVDLSHYRRARGAELAEPADQRELPRPRLGFFGVIDERMDLALLERIATARPAWQLVMLGPVVKIDSALLPRRANLHYLGQKNYAELPQYLAGWDVALMPFAMNESTRFISPTKTLEYLAGGKPVVSTPVQDVVRPYGERGLVHVAHGHEFVDAVERALREGIAPKLEEVDRMLAETSWDRTWSRMSALLHKTTAATGTKVA